MKPTYRQFKLTNSDEIICEIIQWDSEEDPAIVIRGALKLITMEDYEKGIRLFAFRPWMGFADNPETLQTLNAPHIIAELSPSKLITHHYTNTLEKIEEMMKKKPYNLDKVAKKTEHMSDDEFEKYMQTHMTDDIFDPGITDSGETDNVIKFKPKGTLH